MTSCRLTASKDSLEKGRRAPSNPWEADLGRTTNNVNQKSSLRAFKTVRQKHQQSGPGTGGTKIYSSPLRAKNSNFEKKMGGLYDILQKNQGGTMPVGQA